VLDGQLVGPEQQRRLVALRLDRQVVALGDEHERRRRIGDQERGALLERDGAPRLVSGALGQREREEPRTCRKGGAERDLLDHRQIADRVQPIEQAIAAGDRLLARVELRSGRVETRGERDERIGGAPRSRRLSRLQAATSGGRPCPSARLRRGTGFARSSTVPGPHLRVMSYNIRNGRGSDGRIDLDRIAAVIAAFEPEILAVQEVDVDRPRSGSVDQASELASRLGMSAEFATCVERGCERYGIATLTRLPVVERRELPLPRQPKWRRSQPRRALVTRLSWPAAGHALDMVNTHLSTVGAERAEQVAAIVRDLDRADVIVAGDLNCMPWSSPYKALCCNLRAATGRARTWPARVPMFPIDHILYRGAFAVVEAGSWVTPLARRASDHLPVVAVFEHVARAEAA
jgi:endonuclease/exonuclease/phosphatase family metal-dependent hydrolase